MARHLLSARQVQVAREGDTFDGDGLIPPGATDLPVDTESLKQIRVEATQPSK